MNLDREIKSAIAAHGLWRSELLTAIKTMNSEWTPEALREEGACSFGRWAASCTQEEVKAGPEFHECVEAHRRLHKVAAMVLKQALSGKRDAALRSIDIGGDFAMASMEFTTSMLRLGQSVASGAE
ncbi:MAG: CZB domain-containing protein [Bryobacterales bacterium]|nr:CZB domain-containing protein [Bryobacterales bacterium]